jgi:hypothetical protein
MALYAGPRLFRITVAVRLLSLAGDELVSVMVPANCTFPRDIDAYFRCADSA